MVPRLFAGLPLDERRYDLVGALADYLELGRVEVQAFYGGFDDSSQIASPASTLREMVYGNAFPFYELGWRLRKELNPRGLQEAGGSLFV